jgi:hypothetical protein
MAFRLRLATKTLGWCLGIPANDQQTSSDYVVSVR